MKPTSERQSLIFDEQPRRTIPKQPIVHGIDSVFGELLSQPSRAPWLDQMPLNQGTVSIRPRRTIYTAGQALEGVPVICEGWAARVSRLFNGRRLILSFILPGELVSTEAVFVERLPFYVEAITAVRCGSYDRADFKERLAADPRLMRSLVCTCMAEKQEADQLATNLGCLRANERVARLLIHLKQRLDERGLVRDGSFVLPLRQHHMADATGLTPVHVNRVIAEMRNDGIIETEDGVLKISDPSALEEIAALR
jgi:CRP/FNR family transcriptional regulator, anaerobic regulatory protein